MYIYMYMSAPTPYLSKYEFLNYVKQFTYIPKWQAMKMHCIQVSLFYKPYVQLSQT